VSGEPDGKKEGRDGEGARMNGKDVDREMNELLHCTILRKVVVHNGT